MVTIKPGFEKRITDELVLKVASTPEEGDELAKFNAEIHGEEIEEYVKRIYHQHPDRDEMIWFYIQDTNNNQIISCTALLPLSWKIDNHVIKVAEMGFVGTRPSHRGQGLFGILNDYYELAVEERKLVVSVLVGIPNYYRKYGYVFALDRFSGYSIPKINIPQEPIEHVKVRKATEDDLDEIKKLYNNYTSRFVVSTSFDEDKFEFRYMNTTCDELNAMTYIIEEDRKTQGFFSIGSLKDPNQADVVLVSDLTYDQMIKTLQFVKTYNRGTIDSFLVNVHLETNFSKFLKTKGGDLSSSWGWQVKILDMKLFFEQFTPVLEDRIAKSIFKNLTRDISISNYSDSFIIHFVEGKIESIDMVKEFPDHKFDLRIPTPYYTRLYFSDRSLNEIKHIINDTLVKEESKLLIETLFPTLPSIPFSYY